MSALAIIEKIKKLGKRRPKVKIYTNQRNPFLITPIEEPTKVEIEAITAVSQEKDEVIDEASNSVSRLVSVLNETADKREILAEELQEPPVVATVTEVEIPITISQLNEIIDEESSIETTNEVVEEMMVKVNTKPEGERN